MGFKVGRARRGPRRRAYTGVAVLAILLGLAAVACGGNVGQQEPVPASEPAAIGEPAPTPAPTTAPVLTTVLTPVPTPTAAPTEVAAISESAPSQPTSEPPELPQSGRSGDEPVAPELVGLMGWINSEPLTLQGLRGKVVLVDFWTYTCVNCIRTFPHLREWHAKYADMGLVILGVHAPEFEFEKIRDNVVMAVEDNGLEYAIAQDNDHQTWRAFENQFWPAKYMIDKDGYIRYTHFGEGQYAETEQQIRELLLEAGSDILGVVASSAPEPKVDDKAYSSEDPFENQTRELYAGVARNYGALRSGASAPYVRHEEFYQGPDQDVEYVDPGDHVNHFLYLQGLWRNGLEELVHARDTEDYEDYIAIKFSAIEANVVLSLEGGQPYEVRVTLDGGPLDPSQAGADIRFDDDGNSFILVEASDMYHVVQLPEFGSHELRISSNSSEFTVFAYTFGSYLEE